MKCKNTIAMVLAGAMLLPSNAFAADLSQYRDFPNDWSAKSLEQAIDDGLLNGSNGMIDAKGLLTRAQMAAIVSRALARLRRRLWTTTETYCRAHGITAIWARQSRWARSRARIAC